MKNSKKILAMLLVLVMAVALFAACGEKTPAPENEGTAAPGKTDAPASAPPEGANADRVLNYRVSQDTGTLYPFAVSGGFVFLVNAFYEPLWTIDRSGVKTMLLAKDWEVISDTEYKLTLRDDVKFSNGNPMTAEDVMFSMELCAADPRFYLNVKVIDMERTKVTGTYTMDVFYTTYDCTQEVALGSLYILDKESYDLEYLSNHSIGTGPYNLADYVVNSHVTAVARDDYWGEPAKIKQINFKVINEQAQVINAIETGAIDVAGTIAAEEMDYVESLGYNIEVEYGGYLNVACYSLNGALASKEARWAVSHAMDRESMAQIMLSGLSYPASYPASEKTVDYEERFSNMHDTYAVGYNVDLAKQYAEQSGLVGKTLKIITNGAEMYNNAAVILQQNLSAIGVESTISSLDSATYFGTIMDATNFDIAFFYFSCPTYMASDVMANYPDFVPLDWVGDIRDEYGRITKQCVHTYDPVERGNLLFEGLKLFVDECPWYGICESASPQAYSSEVGGFKPGSFSSTRYSDLYFN